MGGGICKENFTRCCALVEKKNRVTRHMGIQPKEHDRLPCNCQINNEKFVGLSSLEVARENHGT